MVETSFTTLAWTWFVRALVFIYVFVHWVFELMIKFETPVSFDINRADTWLLIIVIALIFASTIGSTFIRGLAWLSSKLRG